MRNVFAILVCVCVCGNAFSDGFAVVDLKKVAAESLVGKSIETQIETINNNSKTDLLDLEKQIKSLEKTKRTDADSRKIEELQVMLYDMVRKKKYEISEAYRVAITQLDAKIKEVIKQIAAERGISVVFPHDATVFFDKKCPDLTKEVVERMDNICTNIPVKLINLDE